MASNGDDPSSSLQSLFASLRTSSSRAQSVNTGRNESPAPPAVPNQSDTFNFSNASPQTRSSDQMNTSAQSTSPAPQVGQHHDRGASMFNTTNRPSKDTAPAPSDQSSADKTASLLNLLKFNQSASAQGIRSQPHSPGLVSRPDYAALQGGHSTNAQTMQTRGVSASDLVASSMGRPTASISRENASPSSSFVRQTPAPTPQQTANPQDFLLQLLNRPKSKQTAASSSSSQPLVSKPRVDSIAGHNIDEISQDLADANIHKEKPGNAVHVSRSSANRNESPIRIFGSSESREPTPFDPQTVHKSDLQKESMFTYVNPFDQLTASLPRKDKSKSGTLTPKRENTPSQKVESNGGGKKQRMQESSAGPIRSTPRKLTPGGSEILQSIESAEQAYFTQDRTQLKDLTGAGVSTNDSETVADALNEVGEQVGRQIEHALARADDVNEQFEIKQEESMDVQDIILDAVEEGLRETAAEVKEELEKGENKHVLQEMMPESSATAIKEIIDQAAEGNVDDPQGSADDEKSPLKEGGDDSVIPVYNFPMRAFVSIDLKQIELPTQQFREDAVMAIARLKKDFDQIDRTLATASNDFIIYALPKSGGIRIIRQEDGMDRQIFKETRDRIFNIAIATGGPGSSMRDLQAFIATAVSGSVYWAPVSHLTGDNIQDEDLESRALAFPPVPAHDGNTSGGQLKTRAKRSSRHPEFFAIGRGKMIQIVFPMHARTSRFVSSTFVVDSERYFSDRSLKIDTGKAGKDFTFSEDDTVIVSLDKAGRLRFWDVRDLTNEANGTASKIAPIEVTTPILTFSTASPSEKSWPTSVLFIDKTKPFTKGIALRYLIVGMKQNHTLQLWDLGLGKAVQELNFPHENESDAICSVNYHAPSGLVVVGHPTRNSIYIIHLSAPKYHLPPMSQAKYVNRLASKDSTLPRPDATAIMSGMREYSFAPKGKLRSVDLLPMTSDSLRIADDEDPSLFELYVMHSKGVTCLNIKKEDIGWSKDSKVLNPVDAEVKDIIFVRDLREALPTVPSELSSVNGDTTPASAALAASASKDTAKGTAKEPSLITLRNGEAKIKDEDDAEGSSAINRSSITNGATSTEKSEKKKKKRTAPSSSESTTNVPPSAPVVPSSYAAAAAQPTPSLSNQAPSSSSQSATQASKSKAQSTSAHEMHPSTLESKIKRSPMAAESISLGISSDLLDKELKRIERSVSDSFSKVLGRELDGLYRRFDEDKRVQDAAGAAKQDAILRLVSSTLTDNVEKALARIISTNIQQVVLPSIADVAASTLMNKMPEWLTQQLLHTLPAQLKLALPEAISKAVQTPDVIRVISDQITLKIAAQVEKQFAMILQRDITPAFQNLVLEAVQQMNNDTEQRVSEQLKQVDLQHRQDAAKIDQLTALIRGLSETVHTMAAAQSEFQSEILKLQQQNLQERRASADRNASRQLQNSSQAASVTSEQVASPEKLELDRITASMSEGHFEEGTIQWLQSNNQAALFDNFFVKCSPEYLQQCQTLVALSVSAAVTASLDTNIAERLHWLETILAIIDVNDPDIRGVAPKIMNVLCQRLEGQYMRVSENEPHNPILPKIPPLTRRAREIAILTR